MAVFKSDTGALIIDAPNATDSCIEVKQGGTTKFKVTANGLIGLAGTSTPTTRTTFTQTYSTADATHTGYTADTETTAYTGGTTDSALALNTNLNALRTAYEVLRLAHEDTAQVVNSIIDALQAAGIVA